jgi:hypothetical protein
MTRRQYLAGATRDVSGGVGGRNDADGNGLTKRVTFSGKSTKTWDAEYAANQHVGVLI